MSSYIVLSCWCSLRIGWRLVFHRSWHLALILDDCGQAWARNAIRAGEVTGFLGHVIMYESHVCAPVRCGRHVCLNSSCLGIIQLALSCVPMERVCVFPIVLNAVPGGRVFPDSFIPRPFADDHAGRLLTK